jgi:hypothetical protein
MRNHLLFIALTGLLAGCQAAPQPMATTRPVSAEQADYDAVWQASLDVLREYDFRVDRQDRRDGIITTYPMTGKSWFEFARQDAATARDAWESSLQTIYRAVEIRVDRDSSGKCRPTVRVLVSRCDRPDLQITNASQAFEMFRLTPRRREVRERRAYGEQVDVRPVPLGEDEKLARKIQADIEKKLTGRPE